jgi:hypothetical protein
MQKAGWRWGEPAAIRGQCSYSRDLSLMSLKVTS